MKKEVIETCIWIFCIVVLLGLSLKVMNDGQKLSCDKCTIKFYNKVLLGEQFLFGEFEVNDLFEEYKKGNCIIKWDPSQGYYYNG